ncbi:MULTISPECIES: cupin domain-containing protein [Amycolatopsis]|uniref:Cupin domain-containing protein n=2 Tax=Amycolatopsis TaxID=1813 RepID=A0A1I3ZL35_9PSEU|nr:cupin domain-containing protein [Amycolatopsis sacchari]SFK44783.1 Cupin domain-containing protein [Amycolatopsis sacchari]
MPLDIVTWAESLIAEEHTELTIGHDGRPTRIHGAPDASGQALVTNGAVGADLLRLPGGSGFVPHTHPGHHVLVVVAGIGTITYAGRIHETRAGQVYLVEGAVPHAVGAITDHVILAVGSPHKQIDAEDRMAPVPYEEVISLDGEMTCLLCAVTTTAPERPHSLGCPHCPCPECVGRSPADSSPRSGVLA